MVFFFLNVFFILNYTYFYIKFFYLSKNDIKKLFFLNLFILFFSNFFFVKIFFINFFYIVETFNSFYIPIYYENYCFILINKPFNLIIYNNYFFNNSLFSFFVYFYGNKIIKLFRFGLLNRLDKNTTGLFVFFKSIFFYINYLNQFFLKVINKYYIIFVNGFIKKGFYNIFSNFYLKKIFFYYFRNYSFTKYFVFENFKFFNKFISFVKCLLFTGRTHQIRIHFNFIKRSVLFDDIYSNISNLNYFFRNFIHLYFLNFFFFDFNMLFSIHLYYDMFFFFELLKLFN